MKKNQGFSLIELIVVIAIMAILVGVLAPAYLRYVEKSRRSTDVSAITDIMGAAEKVASEAQYDEYVGQGTKFTITASDTAITLNVTDLKKSDNDKVKNAFIEIANANGATLKSKAFRGNASTDSVLTGTVGKDGNVVWTGAGLFDKSKTDSSGNDGEWFCTYAPDFAKKLS